MFRWKGLVNQITEVSAPVGAGKWEGKGNSYDWCPSWLLPCLPPVFSRNLRSNVKASKGSSGCVMGRCAHLHLVWERQG